MNLQVAARALRGSVRKVARSVSTSGKRFSSDKVLTEETMSQSLRKMEYAVRGTVVAAADKLAHEIEVDPSSHPEFDHILYTNIGNPHQVGQESLGKL
jgi:hypothetical protein